MASDRSKRVRKVVQGEPRLLIRDGRILHKALREENVDIEDLRAAVRSEGIARTEAVRLAVLETDGSISVIPMGEDRSSGDETTPIRKGSPASEI